MKNSKSLLKVKETVEKYGKDRQKLISELKKLAKEGQKSGDAVLVGASYCYIAEMYCTSDDAEGTLTNALKAVAMLKDTDAYELLLKAHIFLSYVYGMQDNHQMSIAECDTANRILKRHRIKGRTRIVVLNNLANSYHSLGDYKTAIRILNECIELAKEEMPDNYSSLAIYSINLAGNYRKDGDPEKAKEILYGMADWIEKCGRGYMICDYYLRCAEVCYGLKDKESADRYTDRALEKVPEDSYLLPLYDDLRKISHILIKNKDRARAGKIVELMKVYSEKCDETEEKLIALRPLAEFCKAFGDKDKALEYYEQLDELYDKRMDELKGIRLNVRDRMKEADAEIHKLNRMMQKNEELLYTEPMTKLLNRSGMLRVASEFIATAARKKKKVGAIFIDIDLFKECNDTYGHAKGDEIIKEVARACKAEETANVRFARYGGDEFLGVTRGLADKEVTDIVCRICRRVKEADIPHIKNPHGQKLTLSAGVVNVAVTENTDTIIEIANYADKALYYAKNAGKNAVYMLDYNNKNADFVKIEF